MRLPDGFLVALAERWWRGAPGESSPSAITPNTDVTPKPQLGGCSAGGALADHGYRVSAVCRGS